MFKKLCTFIAKSKDKILAAIVAMSVIGYIILVLTVVTILYLKYNEAY